MASIPKETLLADLRTRIQDHVARVETHFAELDDEHLHWKPAPKEWSVLECFDHLALTFEYYRPKVTRALENPAPVAAGLDQYSPSRWGRFYMYFALNPRFSFPTADAITPASAAAIDRSVFGRYLESQAELLQRLDQVGAVDLSRTRVPIERGISFNLGDIFKILVYHDEVHFLQAQRVVEQLAAANST